ncbi:MAG: prolyl oligopeptidase family serine peptidase [Clostridia bacterium]|nr:prolyl oligopeptidase family serine peptidase [Clostridia bacterium]
MSNSLFPHDYLAAESTVLPLRQDIYSRVDGYALPMNIYAPAVKNENARCAVLCIHGGSWVSALKKDAPWREDWMRHNAKQLASLGFYAFEITYRSIGRDDEPPTGVTLTDVVSDVCAAMAYIKAALMPEFGFEKIAVIGDSAGAHLALCLALAEDESLHPHAVVACNPVSDCVTNARWHGRLPSVEAQKSVSPRHMAKKTKTKILLLHGTADEVIPYTDSEALFAALEGKGCAVALRPVKDARHAFILYGYNPDLAVVSRCMDEAIAFIKNAIM